MNGRSATANWFNHCIVFTQPMCIMIIKKEYKYSDITARVIGAAMEVHKFLGNGFPEVIYQRSLEKEMKLQGLPFQREFTMPIFYKGERIGTRRGFFGFRPYCCRVEGDY